MTSARCYGRERSLHRDLSSNRRMNVEKVGIVLMHQPGFGTDVNLTPDYRSLNSEFDAEAELHHRSFERLKSSAEVRSPTQNCSFHPIFTFAHHKRG